MSWHLHERRGHGRLALAIPVLAVTALWFGCGPGPDRSTADADRGSTGVAGSGGAGTALSGDPTARSGPDSVGPAPYLVEPISAPGGQLPDSQSVGAELAVRFCSRCHALPAPSSHSAADWVPILRNMFLRMDQMSRTGMMGGMGGMMRGGRGGRGALATPDADQRQALLAYYQSHALRALPPGGQPLSGAGRELFMQDCGRCHALPDPTQYPAQQWPAVVARMRQHMADRNAASLTDEQAREIVAYLEKASGGGRPEA